MMPVGQGQAFPVPQVNLVDPITSKRLQLDTPFSDRLLHLDATDKMRLTFLNTFVVLPRAILRGLRGNSDFSFSDFLNVAKIPYYLGGAVLAASFAAGGAKKDFARQAVGVALYYLGVSAANHGINVLYKLRDGVDLSMRYRRFNGDIEKAFASTQFPRIDLLKEEDYRHMMDKMGIPETVADPHREVSDNIKNIISTSRADKLILGNVLAAIGAGYIARSDAWARLLDAGRLLKTIWRDPNGGGPLNRLSSSGEAMWGLARRGWSEKVFGYAGEKSPWLRRNVLLVGMAIIATTVAHCMGGRRSRNYESPLYTALAPEMNPKLTLLQPAQGNVARGSVFAVFEQARANATLASARTSANSASGAPSGVRHNAAHGGTVG